MYIEAVLCICILHIGYYKTGDRATRDKDGNYQIRRKL